MTALVYKYDDDQNRVLFVPKTNTWYAYAHTGGESYRGKGETKEDAIKHSVRLNEEL